MDIFPVVLCWHEVFLKPKKKDACFAEQFFNPIHVHGRVKRYVHTWYQSMVPEYDSHWILMRAWVHGNLIVLEYLEYPASDRNTILLLVSMNKSKEPSNDAIATILDQSKNASAETFHNYQVIIITGRWCSVSRGR